MKTDRNSSKARRPRRKEATASCSSLPAPKSSRPDYGKNRQIEIDNSARAKIVPNPHINSVEDRSRAKPESVGFAFDLKIKCNLLIRLKFPWLPLSRFLRRIKKWLLIYLFQLIAHIPEPHLGPRSRQPPPHIFDMHTS